MSRWATGPRGALIAFALYLLLSFAFFGQQVVSDLGSRSIGMGEDPGLFMWALKWWPEAVAHGWNPLHAQVAYAPQGVDMAWVTGLPGPSAVLAPITQTAGPIVAFNVLLFLTPALNALTAYLLCRSLGARFWPAVTGGYLFGFSSYVVAQTLAHANLALVFCIPLVAYLVVRRFDGSISARAFVAAVAGALAFQFLISTEVFLTATLFAGLMFLICLAAIPERRDEVWSTAKLTLLAYVVTGVLVAPMLVSALSAPNALPIVYSFSADPANTVIPTQVTALGGDALDSVSGRFDGGIEEQGAYFGLPLLIIAALFWWERRTRFATILVAGALVALLASLGPRLEVLGDETFVPLPWILPSHLPILEYVIPIRLVVFAWLLLAVMAALWLSRGGRSRWVLGALAVVSLLPNVFLTLHGTQQRQIAEAESPWSWPRPVPALFTDAGQRRLIEGRGNVVILPYHYRADGLLWLAEAEMEFDLAGGYVSATSPEEYECWPAFRDLIDENYAPSTLPALEAFLRAKQVGVVAVEDSAAAKADPLLAALPGGSRDVGGMRLYLLPEEFSGGDAADCPDET